MNEEIVLEKGKLKEHKGKRLGESKIENINGKKVEITVNDITLLDSGDVIIRETIKEVK